MIIAVNTRLLLKDRLEGCGYFAQEAFRVLTAAHPEHQFWFFFDRPGQMPAGFPSNVSSLVIGPQARHPLLWKIWFDISVPRALRKLRADLFVSPEGYASLTTRVPQCIVVHDLGFLHHPETYKKSHARYFRRNTPRFLRRAAQVATVSQFSKDDLLRHYRIAPEKIDVVYNGVKEVFVPIDAVAQQEVRDEFTEGRDFFIYIGALQPRKNLISLLKAFSIFKKRQQSSMKLVLTGRPGWQNDTLLQQLNTYKYREDVVTTGYLEEGVLARLLASAYALVYPSFFEGFGVPVLEAMKCGVPVLTSKDSSMQEIGGPAGLYFDPKSHEDMAEQMMRIYKDEALRRQLMDQGLQRASNYSWEKTAALLWDSMLKARST